MTVLGAPITMDGRLAPLVAKMQSPACRAFIRIASFSVAGLPFKTASCFARRFSAGQLSGDAQHGLCSGPCGE